MRKLFLCLVASSSVLGVVAACGSDSATAPEEQEGSVSAAWSLGDLPPPPFGEVTFVRDVDLSGGDFLLKGDETNIIPIGKGTGRRSFIRQEKHDYDNDDLRTAEWLEVRSRGPNEVNAVVKGGRDNWVRDAVWLKGDLTTLIVGDFFGTKENPGQNMAFIRQEKTSWTGDNLPAATIYTESGLQNIPLPDAWSFPGDQTNIIVGDFNGDGADDLIRQEKGAWDNDNDWTAQVYFSNRTAGFRVVSIPNSELLKGDETNLIVGDFNGDGADDFIRQEKNNWDEDNARTAQVYFSNRDGTFRIVEIVDSWLLKGDHNNIIVGDYNGDRKADFIRQEKNLWDDDNDWTAQVYYSKGDGTFVVSSIPDSQRLKGDETNIIPGDFNGDGKTDFIRQEKNHWDDDDADTASLFLSNGTAGSFRVRALPDAGRLKGDETNIIVADFNKDGAADFIRQEKNNFDNDDVRTCEIWRAASTISLPDNDHDGIRDDLEQMLATTYAPLMYIEPDESNYPVNVEWFLQRTRLRYHEDCSGDDNDYLPQNPTSTQSNLVGPPWVHGSTFGHPDAHCGQRDFPFPHQRLTSTEPHPEIFTDQQYWELLELPARDHVGSTNPSEWVTYFHAYPSRSGGVMLQYWHIFAHNDYGFAGIGSHAGDWDAAIHVELDPNLQVANVWFPRHAEDKPGKRYSRDKVTFFGTHPVMTIDGGGHGSYAGPDDMCSVTLGTVSWHPRNEPPTNDPSRLGTWPCQVVIRLGGITWETWPGGLVRAAGQLTHPIPALSVHRGLVNLGEYNPCAGNSCRGARQASSLLAGQFFPLNGQTFIAFSGKWASPRGPVFQGFDGSVYTSWYNNGADQPLPAGHPWGAVVGAH